MLSIFQIFKMVFGVVASVAVLYFLITFAGAYSSSQQDTQRSMIMKNFRQLADDVYLSGNPFDFDLSKIKTDVYFDAGPEPPVLRYGNYQTGMANPMFFRYGDSVSVTKGQLDFGWWKFGFVEAVPEMTVIFNPLETSEAAWNAMRNITAALPDTIAAKTKFMYAFCGYPGAADISQPVERFDFQRALSLSYETVNFYSCSAAIGGNNILVTVSSGCTAGRSGICVNPNGVFYIEGSDKTYYFMDGLDIAAAIIGGTNSDIHGLAGENLYIYKQKAFRSAMKLAADIMAQRAQLLSGELSGLIASGRIESDSEPAACASSYIRLVTALRSLSSALSQPDYYQNNQDTVSALSGASAAYRELAARGCELA